MLTTKEQLEQKLTEIALENIRFQKVYSKFSAINQCAKPCNITYIDEVLLDSKKKALETVIHELTDVIHRLKQDIVMLQTQIIREEIYGAE